MKKEWIAVIAAAVFVCAVVLPQTGVTEYMGNPHETTALVTSDTIAPGDSLNVELGYLGNHWEYSVKFIADGWGDSTYVYLGSSEDAGWATGNTAYFDRNPGTDTIEYWYLATELNDYGTCIPLMNTYGVYLPGPYGLITIKNDGIVDSLLGLDVIIIKRK